MRRAKKTGLPLNKLAWEIQDLMDIPREVKYSRSGNRYEKPTKGTETIRAIFKVITDALNRGERVNIPGFGTFKVIDNPRKYVNNSILGNYKGKVIGFSPVTIPLPPRKLVVFKPSIHLEAMLNQSTNDPTFEERRAMKTWKKI